LCLCTNTGLELDTHVVRDIEKDIICFAYKLRFHIQPNDLVLQVCMVIYSAGIHIPKETRRKKGLVADILHDERYVRQANLSS